MASWTSSTLRSSKVRPSVRCPESPMPEKSKRSAGKPFRASARASITPMRDGPDTMQDAGVQDQEGGAIVRPRSRRLGEEADQGVGFADP